MQSRKRLHLFGIIFWYYELDDRARINDVANHGARSSRSNSRDKFNGFFQRSSNRSLIRVAAANTGSSATGVSSTSTRCPSGKPGDSSSSTTFPRIVPHTFIASPRIHSLPYFPRCACRKQASVIPSVADKTERARPLGKERGNANAGQQRKNNHRQEFSHGDSFPLAQRQSRKHFDSFASRSRQQNCAVSVNHERISICKIV
jgi:hypothetical protein